jgi:ABC-type amino acid transport system permease subunit
MYQASVLVSSTFLPMEIYTLTAAMYFALVFGFSYVVRRLSRKLPTFGYFQARHAEA